MRAARRFIAGLLLLTGISIAIWLILPKPDLLESIPSSLIVSDREGMPLRVFLSSDEKFRSFRPIGDFPPTFIEAILLQEDRYFYRHPGINPVSLIRAAWQTYGQRKRRIGGSTISMQLARLTGNFTSRSIGGKIRQIVSALGLELRYSKQDILEAYMNLTPCGGNIEGFPAAALYYFGKDISQLTLSEQLLLAVMPQDPVARKPSPKNMPAELLQAREKLAAAWVEKHPEEEGINETVRMPVSVQSHFPFRAPHFTDYLKTRATDRQLRSTLDLSIQTLAEEALRQFLETQKDYGIHNGSIMIAHTRSMEILAWVGSANYWDESLEGQVNGPARSRSPGSTLKPFIYALAIDEGLIIPDSLMKDAPGSFSAYTPDNFGSQFVGALPAWKALVDSRNIPAITLANRLRKSSLYSLLQKINVSGLKEQNHYGLSIVLGSAEMSMLEITSLYAALANGGIYRPWQMFQRQVSTDSERRLMSEEAAWLVRDMLAKNPHPYRYRPKETSRMETAFKTGTSVGFKDAWCIALVGDYLISVWIGNFNGRGNTAFIGRKAAAPLLFQVLDRMDSALFMDYRPPWPPSGLRKIELCPVSGTLRNQYCPDGSKGWFIPGVSPIQRCDIHRQVYIDRLTGYRSDSKDNADVRIREFWSSDMLDVFRQAGLPRLTPPPYPPETTRLHANTGYAPQIIHPLANSSYVIDPPRFTSIPLMAVADGDVNELLWFADDSFLGRSAPGEVLSWKPEPGNRDVTVVDDSGRTKSIRIQVMVFPGDYSVETSVDGSGRFSITQHGGYSYEK